MGQLHATLETDDLRGVAVKGITVYTDDPAAPRTLLAIRALVLGSVLVLPIETFELNNLRNGTRVVRRVLRKDPTERGELQIQGLRTSAPWLVATTKRVEQDLPAGDGRPAARAGDWLLDVTFDGATPYGSLQEEIVFSTGLSRQPTVHLDVDLDLRPPVSLPSESLTVPRGRAETVVLSVRRGLDPTLLRVESRPEGLDVDLEPAGGRFYKAHVRWRGGELTDGQVAFVLGDERLAMQVRSP